MEDISLCFFFSGMMTCILLPRSPKITIVLGSKCDALRLKKRLVMYKKKKEFCIYPLLLALHFVSPQKSKGKSWETRAPVLREESVKEEEEEDEVVEGLEGGTVGNGIMVAAPPTMTSPTLDGEVQPQAKEVDVSII